MIPLLLAFLLGSTTALAGTPGSAKRKPNVVFFLVDDLGYMDVPADNRGSFYETPNVDRLAASGMRFTNGYAANPVCSPLAATRAASPAEPCGWTGGS